jgi:hypothetical protein
MVVGEAGYRARGTNQGGKIELRDGSGNEIGGCVWKENEITLFGPDGQPGKLTRLQ